jgi:hypothetical protein
MFADSTAARRTRSVVSSMKEDALTASTGVRNSNINHEPFVTPTTVCREREQKWYYSKPSFCEILLSRDIAAVLFLWTCCYCYCCPGQWV